MTTTVHVHVEMYVYIHVHVHVHVVCAVVAREVALSFLLYLNEKRANGANMYICTEHVHVHVYRKC